MSNVSIKLLREGAKLPTRGSAFAAGYDLYLSLIHISEPTRRS